ncbi:hypothetical protein MPLB_1870043 [Mesorhizobium sp. ORS 3324]|nr:hypothetical protein MPLB_1870043 [Mesorhizobium sp. ORS 3324]
MPISHYYALSARVLPSDARGFFMQDHELTERPVRGWTPWKDGPGEFEIDRVWGWLFACTIPSSIPRPIGTAARWAGLSIGATAARSGA